MQFISLNFQTRLTPNIAINHRASGTGLKTATRFFAGYGGR